MQEGGLEGELPDDREELAVKLSRLLSSPLLSDSPVLLLLLLLLAIPTHLVKLGLSLAESALTVPLELDLMMAVAAERVQALKGLSGEVAAGVVDVMDLGGPGPAEVALPADPELLGSDRSPERGGQVVLVGLEAEGLEDRPEALRSVATFLQRMASLSPLPFTTIF